MSKRATGHGHIFAASGAWHTRLYVRVKGKSVQKSLRICVIDDLHPSKESVVQLATDLVRQAQALAQDREEISITGRCPTCGRLTRKPRENNNV